MRSFALLIIFSCVAAATGQSGRSTQDATTNGSPKDATRTVKQLYEEANGYIRAKAVEFEAKKTPFSETLLEKTKLEQRQLAAKNATIASRHRELAGDDFYYLGMLNWIAENLDGTAENLEQFIAIADADAARKQTARSVVTVTLAKQKKLDAAEALLAEYIKNDPKKLTERARMEGELAKAYQSLKNFARMAPHAEEDYRAAKALLNDNSSRARGLDEILDAGMLVFEAYRDSGNRAKADTALDDMQATGVAAASPSFYYYAVDQKVRFLIDTGRKPQAMQAYTSALETASKSFPTAALQLEAALRLKRKEKHYNLLGSAAPEFANVDAWFPGEAGPLSSMKGKVVLLDFWATWCGPCYAAFPSLVEWQQEFSEQGFEILGLTHYNGNIEGIRAEKAAERDYFAAFRRKEGLNYTFVVTDGQATQLQYGATGLPTTVLIDRKGIIRYIESGTSASKLASLREMIVRLLAEK